MEGERSPSVKLWHGLWRTWQCIKDSQSLVYMNAIVSIPDIIAKVLC